MRKVHILSLVANQEMADKLKTLGAKYVVDAHNFDAPYQNQVSSRHFYDSNVMHENGLHEVGCYMPSMYMPKEPMACFTEHDRFNALDLTPMYEIEYD